MASLIDFLWGMGFWNWVFLGLILCALESVVPGVHFLWFGLSALIVGALTAALAGLGLGDAFTWPLQLVTFAAISIAAVFGVRKFAWNTGGSDLPDLNVRGAQYIGRNAVVVDAITGGRGKVRIGDSMWVATGPDMAAGTTARVTGTNNTVLIVEPV